MGKYYLPRVCRSDLRARPLITGVAGDVPEWFYWDIKAIDPHLYFVYHPWKIMYDNVMNSYDGAPDDARFRIQEWHGQLSFGYPLKRSDCDGPIEEAKWHLWRLCWPHGWCHVTPLEAVEPEYLALLGKRLHLQAVVSDKYSQKEYAKMTLKQQHEARIKKQDEADALYADVQKENSWLINSAMDNMQSGKTAPTTPKKEIITNITPRKIVRPITDTEGGLYLPSEWSNDD